MWLTTQNGFYSAVQHNTEPDTLVVRTRSYADALHLAQFLVSRNKKSYGKTVPATLIETKAYSDYPWRVFVARRHWVDFVGFEAQAIAYGNFKDQVKKVQGYDRATTYSGVWSVMLEVEDRDPANYRKNSKLSSLEQTFTDAGYDMPDTWVDELDDVVTEDFTKVNGFLSKTSRKRNRK
jgi:hypothetical protein